MRNKMELGILSGINKRQFEVSYENGSEGGAKITLYFWFCELH